MDHEQPDGGSAVTAEISEGPAFVLDTLVGSQQAALREDQVQNAVTFLSHPKVRGSSETAKRSFLEKKGLTAEEISEAFKRVPPEAPAAAAAGTSSTPSVGANNLVTYTQQPQQAAVQGPQHAAPQGPPQALVPAQQMQMMQPQRPPVHWSQVVLGMGVAAASIYGLHQLLAPRLSAWSQQLFASRNAAAEAEAQRTAALTAALERLSEGQGRLQETLESLTAAVKQPQRRGDQLGYADSQTDCLACQSLSLGKRPQQQQQQQQYEGGFGSSGYYGPAPNGPSSVDNYGSSSRAAVVRGGGWDAYGPDSSYRAASEGRPGSATSPSGRTPAGAAPSGFYGSSATGFEVTPPPMGSYRAPQPPAQYASSSSNIPAGDPGHARRAGAFAGPEETPAAGTNNSSRPEEAPRSAAFHEVMAMVQAGITPPNVRTDIDDNPPDPSRPLSAPQMPPHSKPWESGTVSSNVYNTPGAAYSSNMVADGPSGFGVRGYGGAAAAGAATPTSAAHVGSSSGPAAAAYTVDEEPTAGSRLDAPTHKSAVGYDLSQLLGADSARDAPWRPPPPPAATVQRPTSSGSTTEKQPLAAAVSAPPAPTPAAGAPAAMQEAGVQAADLPSAASAPAAAAAVAGDPLSANAAESLDAAAAPLDAGQA